MSSYNKRIQQQVKTAFGTKATMIFEFLDFIEDDKKDNAFFIKLRQEDGRSVLTQKSFAFEEIVGMSFI